MSYLIGLVTKLVSKEWLFGIIADLAMDVLAEPLYEAGCKVLDEAVANTETKIDDEIAENLKEWLADRLDI